MNKSFVAALAIATATVPLAAAAQPSYAGGDEQIHGRVTAFNGQYALTVRDDRGYLDNVELHQGTIINPTGLTLAPGMVVSINGFNAGGVFDANEIDTPYTYYAGVPYYEGHPWSYFGAGVGLGFFFGSTGWWHGGYYGRPYAFNGGIRVYNAPIRPAAVYGGGAFRGRYFSADRAHGGYYPHPAFAGHPGPGGFHGGGPHGGFHGGPPH